MEKDNFKDRPIEITEVDKIKVGMEVYICLKAMQPFAKDMDDLSRGVVIELLTRHNHPRGIKVRIRQDNGFEMVGRCTYIVQDGLILTKDGLKDLKDVNK